MFPLAHHGAMPSTPWEGSLVWHSACIPLSHPSTKGPGVFYGHGATLTREGVLHSVPHHGWKEGDCQLEELGSFCKIPGPSLLRFTFSVLC